MAERCATRVMGQMQITNFVNAWEQALMTIYNTLHTKMKSDLPHRIYTQVEQQLFKLQLGIICLSYGQHIGELNL